MKKQETAGGIGAKSEKMERVLEGIGVWAGYYRSNPHRFAIDYLHVNLKLFQIILLFMMNLSYTFMFIGSRGLGKSYLCAIFCCIRCVLYPGTKICIASGTRGQSVNVLEKIMTELKPNSPELASEIDEKETKLNPNTAQIVFKNASYIKVVTASDSARGNRAHVLIIDEFRMVKKDVIDTILRKFLANPRHPKYMDKPEYANMREPLKTMYLSSAYYQDHWSFVKARDMCRFMLDDRRHDFVCGFPYQLALKEDLLMEETVVEQMTETDFNEIKWSINISVLLKPIELLPNRCATDDIVFCRKWQITVVLTGKPLFGGQPCAKPVLHLQEGATTIQIWSTPETGTGGSGGADRTSV